ncbi:hypothetical protein Agub_g8902 [Astrephomene gubernaculifera]|uniref:Uncharacterized protein n=1 Tax=Astrephomene gubernaculifera TaxID=47775 RepID=A0AAD3DSE3_9CHLO|nr:hypothetical protein Agub_g8902 [Astrephomene gubernaculifera]
MPPNTQKGVIKACGGLSDSMEKSIAVDPERSAFTSAIVAALKELESRKSMPVHDLGQRAYEKLQYDLPLVSPEELEGLADTLRCEKGGNLVGQVYSASRKLVESPATALPLLLAHQQGSSKSLNGLLTLPNRFSLVVQHPRATPLPHAFHAPLPNHPQLCIGAQIRSAALPADIQGARKHRLRRAATPSARQRGSRHSSNSNKITCGG